MQEINQTYEEWERVMQGEKPVKPKERTKKEKKIKKKKSFFSVFIKIVCVVAVLILALNAFIYYDAILPFVNKMQDTKQATFTDSYSSQNGYSWGKNQNKLASLENAIFAYEFDNSHLKTGNVSEINPGKSIFYSVINNKKTKIGEAPSSRPCNVVADKVNNMVYYVTTEPIGEANLSGEGFSGDVEVRVYSYEFNPITKKTTLVKSETLINSDENDGSAIRLGIAISEAGDLMVAYGSYDGYLYIYIKEFGENWIFYTYLTNPENESMMYCFPIILDKEHFYVLAVQDYNDGQRVNYLYSKIFMFDGVWTETFVIDVRGTEIERKYATSDYNSIVENFDFILYNNILHVIVAVQANKTGMREFRHYAFENGRIKLKNKFSGKTAVRLTVMNNKLYYVVYSIFTGKIQVVETAGNKVVFRKGTGLVGVGTIFVDKNAKGEINILYIEEARVNIPQFLRWLFKKSAKPTIYTLKLK